MCYTLAEALWLHAAGTCDDLLVAYPTVDRGALRALADDDRARRHITIMADSAAHLDVVDRVLGAGHPEIRLCLDLDISWRPLARRPVNGGGTGSLESTARDTSVTELTAGSGLVGPTLFDAYRRCAPEPALLYALPVVRRPGPGVATLFSGGYVASGSGTPDRLPRPALPAGLRLTGTEGAGELAERFRRYHVLLQDGQVTAVPTYRGEGQCFG
jgi:D-serine deaminase-like pyridoxal phosphate-dependent protein